MNLGSCLVVSRLHSNDAVVCTRPPVLRLLVFFFKFFFFKWPNIRKRIRKKKGISLVYMYKHIARQTTTTIQWHNTKKTYILRQYLFINNIGYYKLRNLLRSLKILFGGGAGRLELETRTFLGEKYHYFLQGHNLNIQSLESIKQSLFLLLLSCCAHPQFITWIMKLQVATQGRFSKTKLQVYLCFHTRIKNVISNSSGCNINIYTKELVYTTHCP